MTKYNGTQRAGVAGWAAWRRLGMLAVLVVAGLAPRAARADDPFETSLTPSPNVLLLLDTSGSMEYLQQEHKVPCCIQGDPLCNDPTKRTRWMMVQDALLGPVTDDTYKCLRFWAGECVKDDMFEDCSDPAIGTQRFWIPGVAVPGQPWVIPQFEEYGTRDVTYGILERYRERIRFGAAFLDSYYNAQTDVDGMFSYTNGYGEPLPWHGQAINVGIRGRETPSSPVFGALTTWGGDDTDINVLNLAVRKEIGESFRYCGSPISGALDDIRHYFTTDPANRSPAAGGTDRFATCRQRSVVLITDGMPNSGEGNPYLTSAMAARALWSTYLSPTDVRLFVIGFSLCPGTTSEGVNVRAALNQIACEGCPSGAPGCKAACGICEANDTDELISCLDQILFATSSSGVTSRTLATTTNQVSADDPARVVQYQFNTGLLPSGSSPWEGILERTAYVCNPATGKVEVTTDAGLYTDFGAQLDARATPRELKTVTTPATGPLEPPFTTAVDLEPFDTTNADLDAAELGCSGAECTDGVFVPNTINYVHGRAGTARAGRRLADIYHASVAVVGRPNMEIPIVSYYQFQEDKWARTQAIYAATNDGVLHAFRANNTTNSAQTGEELWGYVPNYLVPKVHEQIAGGHITNLDSTPTTRDLRIFKGASTTALSDDWRSVLVGGYRQGGRGYYALDVTDPAAPKLLWEINNETDDSSTVADPADYSNLWLTYASPFLGTAFIPNRDLSGGPELGELSVTIFPGGFNPTAPVATTTELYVVSTKTGRLIKKLTPRFPTQYACAGDCNAKPECCAQLITSPVGYGAIPGLVTTRVFVGDDRGRIWRADLSASDPSEWTLDLFYPHPLPPTGEPSPVYRIASDVKFPPALALDKENRLVVIYGTGDIDDAGRLDENFVVSVTERIEFDATASKYVGRAYHNWTLCPTTASSSTCLDVGSLSSSTAPGVGPAMLPGEKLTGVPIVFNQTAYFSTFVPLRDTTGVNMCELGEGRIWGVKYNYVDTSSADDVAEWQNLDDDGVLGGATAPFVAYDDTYIAGITILQRPSCYDATTGAPPMPGLGSGSRETFELVAQVSQRPAGSAQPSFQQVPTVSITIPTPPIINYADSWGTVFE